MATKQRYAKYICEQQSIKYYVFHCWYKRCREQHADPQGNATSFAKLQVAKPAFAGSVEFIILAVSD
jgi:hypothetical protein